MKTLRWLRWASWPVVLSAVAFLGSTAIADDDGPPDAGPQPRREPPPPPPDGPPPHPAGPRDRVRMHVERFTSGFRLNMSVAPVPRALDSQLDLKGEGVLVTHVFKGGAADKGGLKPDDIIVAAGDKPVKSPADLLEATKGSEDKELTLKVVRAGEPASITVTPQKADAAWEARVPGLGEIDTDVILLQEKIKEKLKDAGVDMRLNLIQPGRFLPNDATFNFLINRRVELPDDMSITIRKQGKEPADIEVKQGDKTWNVKDDKLAELPDEVRGQVEGLLGRGPMHFNIVGPGGPGGPHPPGPPGPPHDGPGGPPHDGPPHDGPGPGFDERPRGPDGPGGPDGPRPRGERRRRGPDGPDGPGGPPRGPEGGPDGPPDGPRPPREGRPGGPGFRGPREDGQDGPGRGGNLERRLEEMLRRLDGLHQEIDGLRQHLRDDDGPDRPADDEKPKDTAEPQDE